MSSSLAGSRSVLFVPGDSPRKIERARASAADVIVLDLEDGVAPDQKNEARSLVAKALAEPTDRPIVVRVNAMDTPWGGADAAMIRETVPDAVMVPKAAARSTAGTVPFSVPVVALIETATGLRDVHEIAARDGIALLALGSADLGAELGWRPRKDELELLGPRTSLVLASAAVGLHAPLDAVHLDIRDLAGLRQSAERARDLGLAGKLCIHPAQVELVNEVFTPSSEEIHHAERVLVAHRSALEGGLAVTSVDGRLVDAPVVASAASVLAAAARSDNRRTDLSSKPTTKEAP